MDSTWYPSFSEPPTYPATIPILPNDQAAWLQPQPQSVDSIPLGSGQTKAKKFTAEDWETHEQEIRKLYDGSSLPSIVRLMKERHGLEATRKQYLNKLRKWGLNKNIQPHEMKFMIRKQQSRLLESGKPSAFRVRKRPVPPGKIIRYIRDHGIETSRDNDSNLDESTSPIATPGAISCYTPSATGPLTPHAAGSPRASLSPRLSFAKQGHPFQFSDPGPILSSSRLVAESPGDYHIQSSFPVSTAVLPGVSPSTVPDLDEVAFTGRSPAPVTIPSTPQVCTNDLWPDEVMGVIYDSDNAPSLESMRNKADELEGQGRYDAAEKIYRLVLQQKESLLGYEHPDTIACMAFLAYILYYQGKYKAAEQMERNTLRLSQKVLGFRHPNTLSSMDRLALILDRQGIFEAAEKKGQQVLELRVNLLRSEHPDTLRSMRTMALVLTEQERFFAGERMSSQALQLMQKVLGPDHLDTLVSMDDHAWVLGHLGRHTEAERIGRQALELRQKVLGYAHPRTLDSLQTVAMVLYYKGLHVETEDIWRENLELSKKANGPEHPITLSCMQNLATTIHAQRKFIEAEEMHKQVLELRQKVQGLEHPFTLKSMYSIASTLKDQNRFTEAEEMFKQVLELSQKVHGTEHPFTLDCISCLSSVQAVLQLSEIGQTI
ncbi:kinesin light chain 3 protein [Rutstroemia sp. NJR-2017a BBW]|nr:kinesin light chain 3 protein [Rutstroemia sp. NJR-2017a BBW]